MFQWSWGKSIVKGPGNLGVTDILGGHAFSDLRLVVHHNLSQWGSVVGLKVGFFQLGDVTRMSLDPLEPEQYVRAKPLISQPWVYWIIYYCTFALFSVWFRPPNRKAWFGELGSWMTCISDLSNWKNTLSIWKKKNPLCFTYNSLDTCSLSWKVFCWSTAIDRNFSSVWRYKQPQEVWNMLLRLFSWFPCHKFSCHSTEDVLLSVWCVASAAPLFLNFQQQALLTSLWKRLEKTKWRLAF